MIVVIPASSKVDTLYKIDGIRFYNKLGLDIRVSDSNFHGYKTELLKANYILLVMVDKSGKGVSDDIKVKWNFEKGLFEVERLP